MDARRCISYLTIEHRGEIPSELHAAIGENLYGCDICQDVCPWNVSFARDLAQPEFAAREAVGRTDAGSLARELAALDDESFRRAFRGSPMKRARLAGLRRNAAIVLANLDAAAEPERG